MGGLIAIKHSLPGHPDKGEDTDKKIKNVNIAMLTKIACNDRRNTIFLMEFQSLLFDKVWCAS